MSFTGIPKFWNKSIGRCLEKYWSKNVVKVGGEMLLKQWPGIRSKKKMMQEKIILILCILKVFNSLWIHT